MSEAAHLPLASPVMAAPLELPVPAAFKARLDAAFSTLGPTGTGLWRVSEVVTATCAGKGESSEEEGLPGGAGDEDEDADDAGDDARWRDASDHCGAPLPSRAFCNALDDEPEEDDADRVALADDVDVHLPARDTPVPLDNAYERAVLRQTSITVYELDEPFTVGGAQLHGHDGDALESGAAWRVADALVTATAARDSVPQIARPEPRLLGSKRLGVELEESEDGDTDLAQPPAQKRAREARRAQV